MSRHQRGGRRISLFVTTWLFAIWLLLFANLNALTIIGGIIVALGVQLLFPLPHSGFIRNIHPWHTTILALRFLWDMVLAAVHVAVIVVTGRSYRCSLVRIPLRSDDEIIVAIVVAMTNLVPGTIVVSIDRDKSIIYLHVFDIDAQGGPDGVRATTRGQELRVLRAFGSREELKNRGITL
ncbi:MAG: Na+/H+ antiporter subunit E [Actinomycetaceae bacterium]|nr:Na+/H+ antiporter subunit E [Actinomycetaceae bacterium]